MKKTVAALGFVIALWVNPAAAQAPVDSPAGKPEDRPQSLDADADRRVSEGAPPTASEDAAAVSPEPAPAGEDDSPFDYQASEQISEDLSVSFPVDI